MAEYKTLVKKIPVSPDKKTKQKDYLKKGRLPIVDQGQSLVGGYTDDADMAVKCELPVIVFGDHTRAVKYITFPFGAGADGIKVLQPKENILPLFLYYATQYIVAKMPNRGYARHYQYVEKEDLPVPPLPEQERIVARIEELFSQLDAGVETLKKTKAQLAVYRQAVLKEAFENISTFVPLSDVCQRVFDGPFGSNLKTSDYVPSGVRVVRLENLKNMWFDDSKQSFITNEKYELIASHTVFPTDLIMSTFISDSIKVCRLPNYIEYAVNKADCVGIRLSDNINPDFVMFWLSSKEAYNRLSHQIHGATRPRVNTKQIKAIQIPSAKKEVQDKIVSVIQAKFSVCDNIEQTINIALQQAEAMRQSILKDAFEGRL